MSVIKTLYCFDRMGRRTFYKEEVNGVVTKHHRFLCDNYLCVQKADALNNNSQINLFVWDPTEPIATRPLFTQHGTGYKFFYTCDGNKNISEMVHFETRNGIAAHYDYAPFGAVTRAISASAVSDNTFTTDNPFRFSSEYHDDTLGLVYYNYRHYNPTDGRWISRDLVEEGNGDISQYLFCSNCLSFDMLGLYVPNLDMKECTLTLTFLIVFRYPEDNEDYRLSIFLDKILYESIVGNAFNSNSFALFPKDVPNLRECCPNGIKPQVGFDFIFADDGYTGKRVDYIINIKDEKKGRQRSRTRVRKNVIPESDVFLEDFCYSSTTLAHEFGHGPLELEHPGSDVNNPTTGLPYEKNSFEEYSHTGTDKKGRHVSKEDLMGLGNDLRLFYFDLWTNWSM